MAATRIGIDTGGTFTDLVVLRPTGAPLVHKVPSTPHDPAAAVLRGLADVRAPGEDVDVVHGTTVGINAVLTGRVARTAFVTGEGFEDLIEIGRQARASLYDLAAPKPVLPVPRELRFGVASRRDASGERLARPGAQQLLRLRARLSRARVEAIAIGLLHSYAHPEDEHEIARALAPLGVPITCSAELLPVAGEYERFAAAILNAAIRPAMGSYLERLHGAVVPGRLRLLRSSGGVMSAAEAARYPARAAFSGPAGGVVATRRLGERLRRRQLAALDVGGTSTDVSLVGPEPALASPSLAGLPLAIPAVDVHTVGCGGGSIAWVDQGGALRVGPQSAGADPGPACYGRGDEPTVTDAHVVLGHLGARTLLQGRFPVEPQRSLRAIERLAKRLGETTRRTAEGVLEVAETTMLRALLVITVERAVDPSTVPLVAFGGAGGLHAAALASRLSMPFAIVPADPGAFSAFGLAAAGDSAEAIRPVLGDVRRTNGRQLRAWVADVAGAALAQLGPGSTPAQLQVQALLRFHGQGETLPIAVPAAIAVHRRGAAVVAPGAWDERILEAAFVAAHRRRYGWVPHAREATPELVELRALAEREPPVRTPSRARVAAEHTRVPRPHRASPAHDDRRRTLAGGAAMPVHARAELRAGRVLHGPAVIEEFSGATLVPPGVQCTVRACGLVLAGWA